MEKGESGNPNGRPKRKPDYLADFARILSEPVTARGVDGKSVTVDSFEAAYVQLCKKAMKGDNAALFQAIRIMLDILPGGQEAEDYNAATYQRTRAVSMDCTVWAKPWADVLKRSSRSSYPSTP